MTRHITVKVPGSTSNLGAGFDFLGLALDLHLTVQLVPGAGESEYSGTLRFLDPETDLIAGTLAEGEILKETRLVASSSIPLEKGLGSSGAARVAALALTQLWTAGKLDRDEIYRDAVQWEGHPDNVGPATFGGLILSGDRPRRLEWHPELGVALAVPRSSTSTEAARKILPQEVRLSQTVEQARRAAALTVGLATADAQLIREGMTDSLVTPLRSRLIPGFDAACEAALQSGAWGVTISGAGSAVLAVTRAEDAGAVAATMAGALSDRGNPADPLTPGIAGAGVTGTIETP